jgi:intermediate peptidase
LEVSNASQGELWHEDIYKLAVIDNKTNQLLGFIYCDFYQREEKFANVDCHFTIQCSKQLSDGSFQLPIVVLHLNFPPPLPNRPTLLTFEMMENLFHEFGHAMHSMLAKTRYQHVSGTRCSTDFAEVPSQLMEYYCRDPRILKLFAKHYESQEPMDDRLIHKLCESKKLFAATEMQSQLLNSILDQAFHLIDFERDQLAPSQIVEKYTNEYHSLPFVADTYWHLRYTHLVGYGAKYYSYLISKAIAAKIWNECFERDPLSSSAGENYRKKMLEFGGERKPHELIDSLIGFHINTDSLVKSLTENL